MKKTAMITALALALLAQFACAGPSSALQGMFSVKLDAEGEL